MNLKTKLSILLISIFSLQAISQNNFNVSMASELHEKYWFYRERLKYFIIPGEGPGKSVVFGSRNHWEGLEITLADQTIKLGWYISVLATEYKQLGSQSLETDQTLTELYYAIKAFERLDLCEAYDPWFKDESKKDGFFMRSDVQLMNGEVENDFDEFNFGMTEEDDWRSRPSGLPGYIDNIWYTMNGDITVQDKKDDAMSQDQVSHMLFGLAMVVKCFPNETITFTNTVTGEENFGYNFMINAAGNAANIGDYIGNVNLENGPLSFSLFEMADSEREFWEDLWGLLSTHPLPVADVSSHWTIFDPNEDLVPRGPWAYIYRWGFSEAIRKISGHQVPTSFIGDITIGDGSQMWWAYSSFAPTSNHYNRVYASILASIGNSWDEDENGNVFLENGYLGIGTTNPSAPLDLNFGSQTVGLIFTGADYGNSTTYPKYNIETNYNGRPELIFKTENQNARYIWACGGVDKMTLDMVYYGDPSATRLTLDGTIITKRLKIESANDVSGYILQADAEGNAEWVEQQWKKTGSTLSYQHKVGIGVENTGIHALAVNGSINAKEIFVTETVPGSDYVFEEDYTLMPLTELEKFVNEQKHLPEVMSAKEFAENGYNLGEMDDILLRKVEELTLYIIQQQKDIAQQQREMDNLKEKLENQ